MKPDSITEEKPYLRTIKRSVEWIKKINDDDTRAHQKGGPPVAPGHLGDGLIAVARVLERFPSLPVEGSVDRSLLPVREILNAVLRHDGRSFALAHNHPSGDPEPSDADRRATER